MDKQQGFSLIETLLSLALASVFGLALLQQQLHNKQLLLQLITQFSIEKHDEK